MPITVYTEQQISDQAMAYFRAVFPSKDLSEYGFLGLLARGFAQTVLLVQDGIRQADNDGCPAYQVDDDGEVRTRTSSTALDNWAFVFGVSNGRGGYGRKRSIAASGGRGVPSTTMAAVGIGLGDQLVDASGVVTIQTTEAITTNGPPNTLSVALVAVTAGTSGNLPVGSVLTWVAPPAGLNSTMTLTSALSGGQDEETDAQLLDRIMQRLQNPPKGGTAGDYRRWAEESVDTDGASLGVYRAYVYPLRNGLGTVYTVVTAAGSGTSRQHGNPTAVRTYIETYRPTTATQTVASASLYAARGLKIRVQATPALAQYRYDWDDGGVDTTILSATTTTIVLLTGAVPAGLRNAIAAGENPRVQVQITTSGAAATPYVRQVASLADNVPGVGETTLTLRSGQSFPVAPAVADLLSAGAPFVETVAAAVLAYVDSLGPSRVSGYADSEDEWDDVVRRSQVVKSVLNVKDTDGTAFIKDTPILHVTGVEIAVGAAAYSLADFETTDNSVTAPELAWVQRGGISIREAQ